MPFVITDWTRLCRVDDTNTLKVQCDKIKPDWVRVLCETNTPGTTEDTTQY
jgi:hypothetical protein